MTIPIFDGHNDTLTHLLDPDKSRGRAFLTESETGHLDLTRARKAGMFGGFFAIYTTPQNIAERDPMYGVTVTDDGWTVTMQSEQEQGYAERYTDKVIESAGRIADESGGAVRLVRTFGELEPCRQDGKFAMCLHLEGAEAIREDLGNLEKYYNLGIRSIGPVWSRRNRFGEGVPYRFPSSPDTGPGLTGAGKGLIRECNRLGIMIDCAHMNQKAFYNTAKLSDAPIVVSHTAVHALSASSRHLTDEQIDTVADSDGLVGIWYEPVNVRGDGKTNESLSFEQLVRHFSYIAERVGVEHVAFGSDFDGATMPGIMHDVTRYPDLIEVLGGAGFSPDEIAKIAYRNWMRVIEATWR